MSVTAENATRADPLVRCEVSAWILLAFDTRNRIILAPEDALPRLEQCAPHLPETLAAEVVAVAATAAGFKEKPALKGLHHLEIAGTTIPVAVFFIRVETALPAGAQTLPIDQVAKNPAESGMPDWFPLVLPVIHQHAIEIPYLNFRPHDFVYKFRSDSQRNRDIYRFDPSSKALYQSSLCEAIKATRRTKENSSDRPAQLNFGPVIYYLPSHFGFCLGVQNAIERAYETLAENPDRRVFMLSELIHNPFVNDDLRARGLRFLQTDKGKPLADHATGALLWDQLQSGDIVVIPAFGATLEDKQRLIERGLEINRYDATCMLVEKVWKAAKRYGEAGFTVVIHGKREHEETKATFSSSARYGPCLVIRNEDEARQLAAVILEENAEVSRNLFQKLELQTTSGFDPVRDLEKIAVVNQTTLLRNETLRIINLFENAIGSRYGKETISERLNGKSRGDTLCYATQVNQDALTRTLEGTIDIALVAGGKNSSNTFQLYRICHQRFGERAFYIQSEKNIRSSCEVLHYHFPYHADDPKAGTLEARPFLNLQNRSADNPTRILLTGGASCPDGIIQQIITRINSFFPSSELRPLQDVIHEIEES